MPENVVNTSKKFINIKKIYYGHIVQKCLIDVKIKVIRIL
jgi:hypothetical protein